MAKIIIEIREPLEEKNSCLIAKSTLLAEDCTRKDLISAFLTLASQLELDGVPMEALKDLF